MPCTHWLYKRYNYGIDKYYVQIMLVHALPFQSIRPVTPCGVLVTASGGLMDANHLSGSFNRVDHCVLFKKLLERNTPKPLPLVRLLLRWYKTQHLCVRWMGKSSDYFQVSNGVCQGGVLSPIHILYG